ncbi:MAG: hypothetical protein JWR00_824 [Rubritepida sp.]|nr:hypothetical protein [Rubritepida sp.]
MLQELARGRGVAHDERVADAELQPIQAAGIGEPVPQHLLRDRRLRYAEAAEGAGGRLMRVHRPRPGPHVRHAIRPGGMHRHAAGDGRAPARIGARVVEALEIQRDEAALRIAAGASDDIGGVSLGAGRHAFRTGPDGADRVLHHPGRDGEHRLDARIQLAAEAAAAGRGDDAHIRHVEAEHAGHLLAVHAGRLGAGPDLDAVVTFVFAGLRPDAPREAGLRLDIGMLDEAGLPLAPGDMGAVLQRRFGIAAPDEAGGEHVVRELRVQRLGLQRGVQIGQWRPHVPGDGQGFETQRLHRLARADHGTDRIAAIEHAPRREDRLVLDMRIDAVAIAPGHILRAQHRPDSGMRGEKIRDLAQHEMRMRVRAADGAQPERIGRREVGAVALRAVQLGHAVHARQPVADGADSRRGLDTADRIDDPPVARAAAEHAAQRLLHLGLARRGVPAQQLGPGHQHPGRADAALRRAMRVEARHQRLTFRRRSQALDGLDGRALALTERRQAGAGLRAIHQHRAGAAIPRVAAELRARQPQRVPQRIGQPHLTRQVELPGHAVHAQRCHAASRSRARATSSAAARCR